MDIEPRLHHHDRGYSLVNVTCERAGLRVWIGVGLLAAALACGSCREGPLDPHAPFDLTPFRTMARQSPCADQRNHLFLIDGRLVFWDRRGQCADASYAQVLFGLTVDDVLCRSQDSIAGPMKDCRDERYRSMFETVIANTERADLGLGPEHRVHPIEF